MTPPRSVIHVVPHLDETWGGQATASLSLAKALLSVGWAQGFATVAMKRKATTNDLIDPALMTIVEGKQSHFLAGGTRSPDFRKLLDQQIRSLNPSVIHLHSLWCFPAKHAFQLSREHKVPLVVSPRSELYPQSLQRSELKKAFARRLFVDAILENAEAFHATDESEKNAIIAAGAKRRIFVSSDGVDTAIGNNLPSRAAAVAALGLRDDLRYVLFLSRIHARKGPDLFLEAMIRSGMFQRGWGAIIAGGVDDADLERSVHKRQNEAGLQNQVFWTGHVGFSAKRNCFAACDFFALPTQFENFGIVIAEALACGKPVVTSPTTPWGELPARGAGWIVKPELEALSQTFRSISELPPETLAAMAPAAKLAVADLSWHRAALDMAKLYRELQQRS